MTYKANSPEEYLEQVDEKRRPAFQKLLETIRANIPADFEEMMNYGHMGWVVPYSIYPPGYHCPPKQPLPFLGIAAQKNFIAVYHMGVYSSPELLTWFVDEFPKHSSAKLDMGASCIRFKKPEQIPFELIGSLVQKMSVDEWISIYERILKTRKK